MTDKQHDYQRCPNTKEIENLKKWERVQNGQVKILNIKIDWILGLLITGLTTLVIALIANGVA